MEIILQKKKLKKALPWAVKLIMPIKKYLKANYYQRSKFKVILDYNMTCDNIFQRNVATKIIHDTKITNN
jgi:hypothetical protein